MPRHKPNRRQMRGLFAIVSPINKGKSFRAFANHAEKDFLFSALIETLSRTEGKTHAR